MLAKITWWDTEAGVGIATTAEGEEIQISADMIDSVEDAASLMLLKEGSLIRLDPSDYINRDNNLLRITPASEDDQSAYDADIKARANRNIPEDKESSLEEAQVEWSEDEIISDLVSAFSKEMKLKPDDSDGLEDLRTEIKDSLDLNGGLYSSFGTCGKFKADGTEYVLFPNCEEAEKVAIESVKQDLDDDPSMFNQDFISQHLSISPTDRRLIAQEEVDDLASDMDPVEFVEHYGDSEHKDKLIELDGEDEKREYAESVIEDIKSKMSDEKEKELEDPIQYFVHDHGMYSLEDLMKANFISIDTNAAAADAVRTDGWEHFLSRYDSNSYETHGGLVYFRES